MKKASVLLIILLAAIATSCNNGNGTNIQYKRYLSHYKAYEVEIPADYALYRALDNWLAFHDERTQTLMFIRELGPDKSLYSYAEDFNNSASSKLNYILYQQTDTTCFYRIPGGTSLYSAYCMFMSKDLGDATYVIYISSATLSKGRLEEIINHAHKSLVARSDEIAVIDGKDDEKGATKNFSKRNTDYYSIEYPMEWKVMTNIDEMTDVYIGSPDELLGFTITFFYTDYTLSEINEEGKSNMIEIGGKYITNKTTTINGQRCYLSEYDYEMFERKMKNISYVFKKDNTMYSVKFGSDPKEVDANRALIAKIINTFHIK